jgi:hypothetical protein
MGNLFRCSGGSLFLLQVFVLIQRRHTTTNPAIASFLSDLLREFDPATVEMFRGLC